MADIFRMLLLLVLLPYDSSLSSNGLLFQEMSLVSDTLLLIDWIDSGTEPLGVDGADDELSAKDREGGKDGKRDDRFLDSFRAMALAKPSRGIISGSLPCSHSSAI